MLFQVSMTMRVLHDADPEKIGRLRVAEHARAADLASQAKWLHVWRVVGKWANLSVFEVDSHAELHEIIGSLPLYPYMEVEVTALCPM
jgi:muconolactone D-isomerase